MLDHLAHDELRCEPQRITVGVVIGKRVEPIAVTGRVRNKHNDL